MKLRLDYEYVRSSLLNRSLVPSLVVCFSELFCEEKSLTNQVTLESPLIGSGSVTVAYEFQASIAGNIVILLLVVSRS